MIYIIDYQMGNPGSIVNMLKKIGVPSRLSSFADEIKEADKIILPGVGAFDSAMQNLEALHLLDILHHKVYIEKIPVLGICLGMQLMTRKSEEGSRKGLGWIDAETVRFKSDNGLKVPHMGWNYVKINSTDTLFHDMPEEPRFYFVHSYYVACRHPADILALTEYGTDFCSAIQQGHIFAVQFHPEKSHKYGMKLFSNFVEL